MCLHPRCACHATLHAHAQNHVPLDADLVITEFATNDHPTETKAMDTDPRRQYERLLRRLLNYPNHPAVIQLNTWSWFNMGDPKGR